MREVTFVEFRDKLIENFNTMSKSATHLFEIELDKDELWNLYLDSFPEGTNEIYRERREYDCSCCRHFIKSIGNVVFIINNKIHTIWEFDTESTTYQPVVDALDKYIKQFSVANVFYSSINFIGTIKNHEQLEDGTVKQWEHFYLELPEKFVYNGYKTINTVKGEMRAVKDVFKRSLEEITEDSVKTVLELIAQNSLYRGTEWNAALNKFLECKREYDAVPEGDRNNYLWVKSIEVGSVVGKIRNHSMGTLLVNISEGLELDTAVRKYESIVAPSNYKRPKPIFTKKMLEDAKNKISELGYMDSLERRFATLDDITINDILFANRNAKSRISGSLDVFEEMEKDIAVDPKKFSKVEEVGIKDFIDKVLPTAQSIELLFENKLSKNLVSLIAPKNKEAKSMFKWDNAFGWAYTGNITDSSMKENVKAAGGKVEGVLRCSIQWNDEGIHNRSDYDLHVKEPYGNHIYFGNKSMIHESSGMLDVDIIHPQKDIPAVENIIYSDLNKMPKGTYRFFVHNYTKRIGDSGFRAEIEFNGEIYSFNYNKPLRNGENVVIAEVMFDGEKFTIKEKIPSSASSKEVWGLKTQQFVPVTAICYSPNYWSIGNGTGNQHVFFMLKDCVNTENPSAFFNEYLNNELNEHRKVMEALGSKLAVVDADDQLSGVGFSLTKRSEVVVKVNGSTSRVIKIKI